QAARHRKLLQRLQLPDLQCHPRSWLDRQIPARSLGMKDCRASLDHLTVAALSLEQGVAYVHRALGVVAPPGGSHPLMATHNHLMQLGDGVFLEIIAPDGRAAPQRTRWFGLDDP